MNIKSQQELCTVNCMGTSTICVCSVKSSPPSLYPLHHSYDKLFQTLSHFSVLQATEKGLRTRLSGSFLSIPNTRSVSTLSCRHEGAEPVDEVSANLSLCFYVQM